MKIFYQTGKMLVPCLILALAALAALSTQVLASDLEVLNVAFKPGKPGLHDSLDESVGSLNDSMEILNANAKLIKKFGGKYKVKIAGFTDTMECSGEACSSLSLRRAKFVSSWLLANGISASDLAATEGHGSEDASKGQTRHHL